MSAQARLFAKRIASEYAGDMAFLYNLIDRLQGVLGHGDAPLVLENVATPFMFDKQGTVFTCNLGGFRFVVEHSSSLERYINVTILAGTESRQSYLFNVKYNPGRGEVNVIVYHPNAETVLSSMQRSLGMLRDVGRAFTRAVYRALLIALGAGADVFEAITQLENLYAEFYGEPLSLSESELEDVEVAVEAVKKAIESASLLEDTINRVLNDLSRRYTGSLEITHGGVVARAEFNRVGELTIKVWDHEERLGMANCVPNTMSRKVKCTVIPSVVDAERAKVFAEATRLFAEALAENLQMVRKFASG